MGLRGNVRTPSIAHWITLGRLDIVMIEVFRYLLRYLLRLRRYKRKSVEVGIFRRRERVTLSANFRGKGASPTNHCWCQHSRVIALSYSIKISAVHHLLCHNLRV